MLWPKAAFLGLFCLGLVQADDVSWTAPQIYTRELAGLVTPRSEILDASKAPRPDDGAAGEALVDERIHYVDADGGRFIVRQVAYKTLSESGVDSNSSDVFSFRKKREKFYIILGETIQPDGTAQEVKPDAVIVQSPQLNAQYSEYDDESEVRIVYPSVRPGSITHSIVIIESLEPEIKGQYAFTMVRGSTWATAKERFVLDLPDALRQRLKIDPTGPDQPTLTEEKVADGRSRLTWTKLNLAAETEEVDPAPEDQAGSAVHLSTLSGWEDVSKWYYGLLQGRDEISPGAEAEDRRVDGEGDGAGRDRPRAAGQSRQRSSLHGAGIWRGPITGPMTATRSGATNMAIARTRPISWRRGCATRAFRRNWFS